MSVLLDQYAASIERAGNIGSNYLTKNDENRNFITEISDLHDSMQSAELAFFRAAGFGGNDYKSCMAEFYKKLANIQNDTTIKGLLPNSTISSWYRKKFKFITTDKNKNVKVTGGNIKLTDTRKALIALCTNSLDQILENPPQDTIEDVGQIFLSNIYNSISSGFAEGTATFGGKTTFGLSTQLNVTGGFGKNAYTRNFKSGNNEIVVLRFDPLVNNLFGEKRTFTIEELKQIRAGIENIEFTTPPKTLASVITHMLNSTQSKLFEIWNNIEKESLKSVGGDFFNKDINVILDELDKNRLEIDITQLPSKDVSSRLKKIILQKIINEATGKFKNILSNNLTMISANIDMNSYEIANVHGFLGELRAWLIMCGMFEKNPNVAAKLMGNARYDFMLAKNGSRTLTSFNNAEIIQDIIVALGEETQIGVQVKNYANTANQATLNYHGRPSTFLSDRLQVNSGAVYEAILDFCGHYVYNVNVTKNSNSSGASEYLSLRNQTQDIFQRFKNFFDIHIADYMLLQSDFKIKGELEQASTHQINFWIIGDYFIPGSMIAEGIIQVYDEMQGKVSNGKYLKTAYALLNNPQPDGAERQANSYLSNKKNSSPPSISVYPAPSPDYVALSNYSTISADVTLFLNVMQQEINNIIKSHL